MTSSKNDLLTFVHVTSRGVVFVLFRTCDEVCSGVFRGGSIAVLAAAALSSSLRPLREASEPPRRRVEQL